MTYQTQWFDRNIPFWDKFFTPLKGKSNLHFLEIGCFEGRATIWLLKNVLTDITSDITVIDTFEGSPEFGGYSIDNSKIKKNFIQNTVGYSKKVHIKDGLSSRWLIWMLSQETPPIFDFIYIDGSHVGIDVLRDGVMACDLLKPGGAMIFDDYNWDMGSNRDRPHDAIESLIKLWGGYYGKWLFWMDQAAFIKK